MIVIKYYDLYFQIRDYSDTHNTFVSDFLWAGKYAHIDVAKQAIIDNKLPEECKVVIVTIMETVTALE